MSPEPRSLRESCAGPATVVVDIGAGSVEVRLAPESGPETEPPGASETTGEHASLPGEVRVTVDVAPSSATSSMTTSGTTTSSTTTSSTTSSTEGGVTALLGWLERLAPDLADSSSPSGAERAERALAAVEIGWEDGTLTVRGPRDPELCAVGLAVTVTAPDSSALRIEAGVATVRVSGRSGPATVVTTGAIALADAGGPTDVRCGAGRVTVGRATAPLTLTGGAGRIEVGTVLAHAEISTGAGRVHLREVGADVTVRSGAGAITVDDASSGRLDLSTRAGAVRIGVHDGVDAEVDLRTQAGRATSDLPVGSSAPAAGAPLSIRGRSGAGEVRVGAVHA